MCLVKVEERRRERGSEGLNRDICWQIKHQLDGAGDVLVVRVSRLQFAAADPGPCWPTVGVFGGVRRLAGDWTYVKDEGVHVCTPSCTEHVRGVVDGADVGTAQSDWNRGGTVEAGSAAGVHYGPAARLRR